MKTKKPMAASSADSHIDFITRKSDDIQKAVNIAEKALEDADSVDQRVTRVEEQTNEKLDKIDDGIERIKTMITDQSKIFISVATYTQDRVNDTKLSDSNNKVVTLMLQQMEDKIKQNEIKIAEHEKANEPIRKTVTSWLGVAVFLVIAIPTVITLLLHFLK